MKFLILSTLLAAAAAQTFVGQPAQLVLRRSQNRAILQLGQNTFGSQGNQLQQSFSGSQGFSGSQQGVSGVQSFTGAQQGFSDTIPVFLDSTQSQGFGGSRQDFSTTSQSARGQSSQGFGSPRQSPTSSQANFRSSQQSFSGNQQEFAGPQQNTLRSQQDPSSFSQSSSLPRQQQGTSQPSGNQFQQGSSFQGSASSQISGASRASSQFDNRQLQRSGDSTTTQEEVGGVFESLNLPSGATLLLGDISTNFDCVNQPYGYYADQQNSCRVFHICYPALFSTGRVETYQYSFMCGEGTQFDQKEMTCVKESSAIPCSSSPDYYYKNGEFGLPEERANL